MKGAGTPRDSAGRFEAHARCEFCGGAARGDYWDPDLDSLGGLGEYLCARVHRDRKGQGVAVPRKPKPR